MTTKRNFNAVTGIAWEGIDEDWARGIKENQWWACANISTSPSHLTKEQHEKAIALHNALIKEGGEEVCMPFTDFESVETDLIINSGLLMGRKNGILQEVDFLEMQISECHENTAKVKQKHPELHACTGFYLCEFGMWREHSWLLSPDKKNVIETCRISTAYFGIIVR
jgi:hypothetical protein